MKGQQKTTFVQKRTVKISKTEKLFMAGEKLKLKMARDKQALAKTA